MDITTQILLYGFGIALILGAVAQKTNFCTMGAVSDYVNMGHTGRMRAWFLAIGVAILGVLLLELLGLANMAMTTSNATSQPPYRIDQLAWPRYILGGIIFGIGMTLGSGCGNKTMLRLGGGNLKSIVVILSIGVAAYMMLFTSWDHYLFLQWMNPLAIDLGGRGIESQEIGVILGGLAGMENPRTLAYIVAGIVGLGTLAWVFKSADLRSNFDNILGGGVIGLCVVAAWYVTAGPMGAEWMEALEWGETQSLASGAQSYTFIAPAGQFLNWLTNPTMSLVSFAMAALAGVIVGSLAWSLISRTFRWEWFSSFRDFMTHVLGGLLMGVGGVLAMGCTIGQGVTGVSTMALGSFLALGSIIFGSALTMKIQYYKMVYEDEASFGKAFVTALVDMRLLPSGMRKLEAV
ncbi:YeeE/YedE family protein [Ectothiorhodospiraceae bacterium 2226]|nr:YeeE/YedE family protein [Ectothiorhodospiraceae bacterium 2226]